jgi:hypothetical protein
LNGIKLAAENHRNAVAYAATIADHVQAAQKPSPPSLPI